MDNDTGPDSANAKNRHQCTFCTKTFTFPNKLQVHVRTHTGEKPYRCDVCSRSFARSDSLAGHKRIHTGEKPYHCEQCNYSSCTSSELVVHKRIHTGEKPYHCDFCDRYFTQSSHLKTHKRTHCASPLPNPSTDSAPHVPQAAQAPPSTPFSEQQLLLRTIERLEHLKRNERAVKHVPGRQALGPMQRAPPPVIPRLPPELSKLAQRLQWFTNKPCM
jgi:hypothetical protein